MFCYRQQRSFCLRRNLTISKFQFQLDCSYVQCKDKVYSGSFFLRIYYCLYLNATGFNVILKT